MTRARIHEDQNKNVNKQKISRKIRNNCKKKPCKYFVKLHRGVQNTNFKCIEEMSIILRQTFATTRWNKVIQLPISTKQVKLIHVSKCLVKSQEDTKGQVSPASNQKGAELSTSFAKKGT